MSNVSAETTKPKAGSYSSLARNLLGLGRELVKDVWQDWRDGSREALLRYRRPDSVELKDMIMQVGVPESGLARQNTYAALGLFVLTGSLVAGGAFVWNQVQEPLVSMIEIAATR